MTATLPLRIAVFGTGQRVEDYYAPIFRALSRELRWVGVWGRRPDRVAALARKADVPGYTDMDRLVEETRPDILLLCVNGHANGVLGRQLAEYGLPLFLETPIAEDPDVADEIIRLGREKKFPIEVSEQFHRRPVEEAKRLLIRNGVFGRILFAANDFVGHGYHGVSMIRSFIGLDRRVVKVSAAGTRAPILARVSGPHFPIDQEEWESALLEFDNGSIGLFTFTSIAYYSNLRWLRTFRFFGEKGMGSNEDITLTPPGTDDKTFVRLERVWREVEGGRALESIVAHTDPPSVWKNPFADRPLADEEQIATALCLRSLVNAVAEGAPPDYGPLQARTDQVVTLAIRQSIERGEPVIPKEPVRVG